MRVSAVFTFYLECNSLYTPGADAREGGEDARNGERARHLRESRVQLHLDEAVRVARARQQLLRHAVHVLHRIPDPDSRTDYFVHLLVCYVMNSLCYARTRIWRRCVRLRRCARAPRTGRRTRGSPDATPATSGSSPASPAK